MRVVLTLIGALVANLFKSPHRVHLRGCDRALLVWLTWFWPSLLGFSRVVQPETILRWHRAGFRAYWRWKSRGQPGRPKVSRELRELVSPDEQGQPVMGSPAYPWRTAEAWLHHRRVDRLQVHGQTSRAAVADLADVPAQPCRGDRGD